MHGDYMVFGTCCMSSWTSFLMAKMHTLRQKPLDFYCYILSVHISVLCKVLSLEIQYAC